MWAQQLDSPRTFVPVEVATPTAEHVGPGQVLLRVRAGGLCGSDLPAFHGRTTVMGPDVGLTAPQLPGYPMHEVVGDVVFSRHPDIEQGESVVGWASAFDAISEYCISDGTGLVPYPGLGLRPEIAVMVQPLACVLYAAEQLDVRDKTVAVIGLGPIGLLFAHVLKSRGARRVTGIDRVDRSDMRKHYHLDEVIHASSDRWAARLAEDDRAEVVVEAVGHNVSTMTDSIQAAAFGGHIYYFGVPDDAVYPFPMKDFLRKNLTLTSGATINRQRVLRDACAYLEVHRELADNYVTHAHPAHDVQAAFDAAASARPGQCKIVLTMEV